MSPCATPERPATGDPRFFSGSGPQSLAVVAGAAGSICVDHQDLQLHGIAPLHAAEPTHVSFLDNRRYLHALRQTRAGAVILLPELVACVPKGTIGIGTSNPYEGWARVAALFHPADPVSPGVHPSVVVEQNARIDPTAEIGPFCRIGSESVIAAGCRLEMGVSVGRSVVLGPNCRIGAHASLSHALLGARVYVQAGARIGQEGFGFAATKTGFLTVPQLGLVVIENDVEIGANSTVDRGSACNTVIGAGTRIDNQVQIGHNVKIGRCCVLVSHVAISGSTEIGDFVQIGGQAGFAGHLRVGSGAQIGAQAGVISDVEPGARMLGSPAQPVGAFFRQVALLKRLVARRGAATE